MGETINKSKGLIIKSGSGGSVKVKTKGDKNNDVEIKKYSNGDDVGSIKTASSSS